ncbi:aminotransferase class I/II-fold pyridoxal phosphate-dependent enzyme [Streptomyces zhihengii]
MTGNLPDLHALAHICRERDALLYIDDAHGFGVIGERDAAESSPYGSRGNSIIRHLGIGYDNVILVGGFSKAYSSLLAFLTAPPALKAHLKVAAAPICTPGPRPPPPSRPRSPDWRSTTGAATNSAPNCTAKRPGCSTTSAGSASPPPTPTGCRSSRSPRRRQRPRRRRRLPVAPGHLRHPRRLSARPPRPGGLPRPDDGPEHRRGDRRTQRGAHRAHRTLPAQAPHRARRGSPGARPARAAAPARRQLP